MFGRLGRGVLTFDQKSEGVIIFDENPYGRHFLNINVRIL